MNFREMQLTMETVFKECDQLRAAGQKEYAHEGQDAFRNFNSIAKELEMDRKQVLWVYAKKHMDGIAAFIRGHKSQREDVRGRINDLIVYMTLLRSMIDEEEQRAKLDPGLPPKDRRENPD